MAVNQSMHPIRYPLINCQSRWFW